jgi:hypothetical protein
MHRILTSSAVALVLTFGLGYASPAVAQADATAIRKSCVSQVRKSLGLKKGQPLGRGHSHAINACIANGGKL